MKTKFLLLFVLVAALLMTGTLALGVFADTDAGLDTTPKPAPATSVNMTEFVAGGAVPEGGVVLVKTAEDFNALADAVNKGTVSTKGVTFLQIADITFGAREKTNSNFGFIGNKNYPFEGVYDGNGYALNNLIYGQKDKKGTDATERVYSVVDKAANNFTFIEIAPFGYLKNATVCNLKTNVVKVDNINGYVAGIAVCADASNILGCYIGAAEGVSLGSISNNQRSVGFDGGVAVVAKNGTVIDGCIVDADIQGSANLGGIVGDADGVTVRNCAVYGNVIGSGKFHAKQTNRENIGGIVGNAANTTVVNCAVYGDVTGYDKVGGIAGTMDANSSATNVLLAGAVSLDATNKPATPVIGALVGSNQATLAYSYAISSDLAMVGDGTPAGETVGTVENITASADTMNVWVTTVNTAENIAAWVTVGDLSEPCAHFLRVRTDAVGSDEPTHAEDVACSLCCDRCGQSVENDRHVLMGTYEDGTAVPSCADLDCLVCGVKIAGDGTHETEGQELSCTESVVCTACHGVVEEAQGHKPNWRPASCLKARECDVCGFEIEPKLEHMPGAEATCVKPQKCKLCASVLAEATGIHDYNREEPTCTKDKSCEVCGYIPSTEADGEDGHQFGHKPTADATCTAAQKCETCHLILQSALTHEYDWTKAVWATKPTATEAGVLEATCSHCGQKTTKTILYSISTKDNKIAIDVVDGKLFDNISVVLNILANEDFEQTVLTDGYSMLQIVDITLKNGDEAVQPEGMVSVKLQLNKSVAQMDVAKLKLYHIADDGTAAEITDFEVQDGYIIFMTEHFSKFAVAAETEAAIDTLGKAPLPTGLWIGLGAGAAVVIAAVVVVAVVMTSKKKKGAAVDVAESDEQ